jgi:hypothetical protein
VKSWIETPSDFVDPVLPAVTIAAPPSARLHCIVVVPARDEASRLAACLQGLLRQVDRNGRVLDPATYEIILLLNNCADESAATSRRAIEWEARLHGRPLAPVHLIEIRLPRPHAHVGAARRLAMDAALRRFRILGRPGGIIASTDADTIVAPDWLAATMAEVAAGAEAVGGRLLLPAGERMRLPSALHRVVRQHRRYERLLDALAARLDPDPYDFWPRHGDHGGASLAATALAYARSGGLPPLPSGEDAAFYRALKRSGSRFRHSPHVRVFTSGRLAGRAEGGMAATLRGWQSQLDGGEAILVENPRAAAERLAHRAALPGLRLRPPGRDPLVARLPGVASNDAGEAHPIALTDGLALLSDQLRRGTRTLNR